MFRELYRYILVGKDDNFVVEVVVLSGER